MNNLKAEEYFLDLYKSTENEYHQLIRAVRIDSPNSAYSKKGESDSKYTTISIVAIFRRDKKKYTVGTYIISDFEADFETIKKGGAGYLETKNIASDENFNKKELDAFVLDEKSQLEVINNWIKFTKERGPWSIIQDPWNPSVIADFIPRSPQPWDKKVEKPVETIIGTPSNAEMIIAGSPSIAPVELGLTFSKIQLIIDGIPDDLSIPAKTDMPWFYVYVGDLAKKVYDEFNDLGDLDPEYSEDVYRGKDEESVSLENQIDDAPEIDTTVYEYTDVEKSEMGIPPKAGSKLFRKIGSLYYLVNSTQGLAGHRLINVVNDLEKYLRLNGFPGANIGSNGIMRDLVASTYPSSSARAPASLHGAGLAIDVTFNIPGKSWKSYYDNKNLSSDPSLTRAIAQWVAGQKDLAWGAQWGEGSKPSEGIVNGRGITEYHHFEIKSNLIASYWKPFEKELTEMGFDITKLNSPGKNSTLMKLNKVFLNSVGIA